MIELGKVIGRDGKYLLIEVGNQKICSKCELIGKCTKKSTRIVRVLDENQEIKVGSIVELSSSPAKYILAAFLLFILPILFLIGFYFIGYTLFRREPFALLFSLVGLALSLITLVIISRFTGTFFLPKIIKLEE